MGVTGTSNDRTVYFDLFLTGYFILFFLIPGTYTGTAFITTTAILSDSFFVFGTNPYRHRLYGKRVIHIPTLFMFPLHIVT